MRRISDGRVFLAAPWGGEGSITLIRTVKYVSRHVEDNYKRTLRNGYRGINHEGNQRGNISAHSRLWGCTVLPARQIGDGKLF